MATSDDDDLGPAWVLPLAPHPRKGRGALSNPTGRFEPESRADFDDGWADSAGSEADLRDTDGPLPEGSIATQVRAERIRSILTRNDSPDVSFDRSINPYRGCEHGCGYCFARPSHNYLGWSAGLDFETKLVVKPEAAAQLRRELARPSYRVEPIAMGTNTDPYQPIERTWGITRSILEVMVEHDHPVSIVTKSALVLRDLDLLAALARKNLAAVFVSVTSLDATLAGTLEPRAARPARRLDTLRELAAAGVPVGVLASPLIPAISDHELEAILAAAHDAGARWAGYALLRLPWGVKEIFTQWLEAHYPERAARVLSLLRQIYGGELYDSTFGTRGKGTGAYADLVAKRYAVATQRLHFAEAWPTLDTTQFHVPGQQLRLF